MRIAIVAVSARMLAELVVADGHQAIAFERHPTLDFTHPAALARFSAYMQSVTITAGSTSSINLNVVPQSETEAKP